MNHQTPRDLESIRDDIDRIKETMETETGPRNYQHLDYLLRVAEAELESRKETND
jgi:pyrroloquinoline quinone (PQQ) biosynthesis protein C